MDIARYIGLFLLKNHFCYIHGLGNLEIKKKGAYHDGASLNGPSYQVIITPGGSIDDTLANFIATNEQISISKAANTLRDFSTQARADLQEGKDVVIPSLGKFVEENGKIIFITDPQIQYTPRGIPVLRNAVKQPEPVPNRAQQNAVQTQQEVSEPADAYTPYLDAPDRGTNWRKIATIGGLAALVIVCVVLAINYFNSKPQEVAVETVPVVVEPVQTDSSQMQVPTATPVDNNTSMDKNGVMSYNILLQDYDNAAKADRRIKTLTSYGYTVEMKSNADSTRFFVLLPMTSLPADTTHVLDSIARILKPSGVSIYRQ